MECLQNIFGITRSGCQCITDLLTDTDDPNWYKISTSGLYLDELEGIVSLFAVDESGDCQGDLLEFLQKVCGLAAKYLTDDILVGLTTRFREGTKPYSGKLAGNIVNGQRTLPSSYAGLKISTAAMNGGQLTIKKINTQFGEDASFNIDVYRVDSAGTYFEFVSTIPVVSVANTLKENILTDPLKLPLSEEGYIYYFLYSPVGKTIKENTLSCGCGSSEIRLKQFVSFSGVAGDDLNSLPYFTNYLSGMGLSMEVDAGCDASSIICTMFNDDIAARTAMAYAARYKAGELVHEYILKSNNINRYTMSNREFLWGKRNHFRKEYNDRVTWLSQTADINSIDCYVCNDKRVTKGGILI